MNSIEDLEQILATAHSLRQGLELDDPGQAALLTLSLKVSSAITYLQSRSSWFLVEESIAIAREALDAILALIPESKRDAAAELLFANIPTAPEPDITTVGHRNDLETLNAAAQILWLPLAQNL